MHTYMHASMHTWVPWSYLRPYAGRDKHAYMCTSTYTYIHTYMHTCIHEDTNACMHTGALGEQSAFCRYTHAATCGHTRVTGSKVMNYARAHQFHSSEDTGAPMGKLVTGESCQFAAQHVLNTHVALGSSNNNGCVKISLSLALSLGLSLSPSLSVSLSCSLSLSHS